MARRQGFGRQLVQGLLAAAWELGARQAYLQVGTDNTAARNLYRQLGPISFAGKTLEELGEMFSERI